MSAEVLGGAALRAAPSVLSSARAKRSRARRFDGYVHVDFDEISGDVAVEVRVQNGTEYLVRDVEVVVSLNEDSTEGDEAAWQGEGFHIPALLAGEVRRISLDESLRAHNSDLAQRGLQPRVYLDGCFDLYLGWSQGDRSEWYRENDNLRRVRNRRVSRGVEAAGAWTRGLRRRYRKDARVDTKMLTLDSLPPEFNAGHYELIPLELFTEIQFGRVPLTVRQRDSFASLLSIDVRRRPDRWKTLGVAPSVFEEDSD